MSTEQPAGGERPMDRPIDTHLPEDFFDKLSRRIRHIGRLTFGELPWRIPAPCDLWKTAWLDDNSGLEVGYWLQPGAKPGRKNRLSGCSVMTMDREPWQRQSDFWLCNYKTLELSLTDKTYNLSVGACIEDDDSDLQITLDLAESLPGQETVGPDAWEETRRQIEGELTVDEYRMFMRRMRQVVKQLED